MTTESEPKKLTAMELLQQLRDEVRELKAWKARIDAAFGGGGREATDEELDAERGDPAVRKPLPVKYWKGEPFAGRHYSQLDLEQLAAVARYKDSCSYAATKGAETLAGAERETKLKYAGWDLLDADRARGWARRKRAGWQPPPEPAKAPGFAEDHNPFKKAAPPADDDYVPEDEP